MKNALRVTSIVLCFLAKVATSWADQGVYEINQLCAEQSGCFAGDSPGYPVTITNPGSYMLTGSIDISSLTGAQIVTVIEILSSEVSLDLNGQAIIGPVVCTDVPVTSCSPSGGAGDGIRVQNTLQEVSIHDGLVRGMGRIGVYCVWGCRIERITATHNGNHGFRTVNASAILKTNIARTNGGSGFSVQGHIEANLAEGNAGYGFQISGGRGSLVVNNNGIQNAIDGFFCGNCSFQGNRSVFNAMLGVTYSGHCASGGNHFYNNAGGDETGSCGSIGVNICSTSVCP